MSIDAAAALPHGEPSDRTVRCPNVHQTHMRLRYGSRPSTARRRRRRLTLNRSQENHNTATQTTTAQKTPSHSETPPMVKNTATPMPSDAGIAMYQHAWAELVALQVGTANAPPLDAEPKPGEPQHCNGDDHGQEDRCADLRADVGVGVHRVFAEHVKGEQGKACAQ
jgi:hypothetical protein